MSRVGIEDAFRALVEKGMTPERAVDVLDSRRRNGKLDIWCDGTKRERSYTRKYLRFELGDDDEIEVIGQVGIGGWARWDQQLRFEVDANRLAALIAEETEPKPKPGGRPRADVDVAAVKAEIERRLKVGENASQRALAWHFRVDPRTIARRLKEK